MKSNFDFDKFSPRILGGISTSPREDIDRVERGLSLKLPLALTDLLMKIKGAVIFDKDLAFTSTEANPWQDKHGRNEIALFYGIAPDVNGLLEKNSTYHEQTPVESIVIGECPGGNLLCLDRGTGHVQFFDHEAPGDTEGIFMVAKNFDDFLEKIEVVADTPDEIGQKIVQGDSYLDF